MSGLLGMFLGRETGNLVVAWIYVVGDLVYLKTTYGQSPSREYGLVFVQTS